MTRPTLTYSGQKSSTKMTQRTVDIGRNNIFDLIIRKENVFDNSASDEQIDNVKATSKRKKRKRKKDLDKIREVSMSNCGYESGQAEKGTPNGGSLMLFVDDEPRKAKKKRKDQLKKVERITNQQTNKIIHKAQIHNFNNTSSLSSCASENKEGTDSFVIEEAALKDHMIIRLLTSSDEEESDHLAHFDKIHKFEGDMSQSHHSLYFNCERMRQEDADCSAEIPREATQSLLHCHRSLAGSPLFRPTLSDEGSVTNSGMKNGNFVSGSSWHSSRNDDSVHSFEQADKSGRCSRVGSPTSEYTYTFVSTYTEDTTTATGSTKAVLTSPPVKMNQRCTLNSTVYKGKDCIGVIEFPDSVSPISKQNENCSPSAECMVPRAVRSHKLESSKISGKSQKQFPRYSTVLFGSDNSCTLSLDSMDLSTIHSEEIQRSESQIKYTRANKSDKASSRHTSDGRVFDMVQSTQEIPPIKFVCISSRQSDLEVIDEEMRQWKPVMTSTPQDDDKMMSINLSPIELHESEQTGLQLYSSKSVNSDEIIVPSLLEPPRIATEENELSKDGCADPARVQAYRAQEDTKKLVTSTPIRAQPCLSNSCSNCFMDREYSGPENIISSEGDRVSHGSSCNVPAIKTVKYHNDTFQIQVSDSNVNNVGATKTKKGYRRKHSSSLNEKAKENEIGRKKCRRRCLLQERKSKPPEGTEVMTFGDPISEPALKRQRRLAANICCINRLYVIARNSYRTRR